MNSPTAPAPLSTLSALTVDPACTFSCVSLLVFADVLELGEYAETEHYKVGEYIKLYNKENTENKIDYLITKESGATGGEIEKIEACRECGTRVLVVKRPYVNYGKVYNEINELVEDVKNKVL